MKALKYITLLFVTSLFLPSCSDESEGMVAPAELIYSVHAAATPDNTLRMNITVEFKKEVMFQVEYWKQDDEDNKTMSLPAKGSSSSTATLVFLEPNEYYDFRIHAVAGNARTASDKYTFRTGTLPGSIPEYTLQKDNMDKDPSGYILLTKRDSPGFISVINSRGKVVWYENVPEGVRVANFDPQTNTFTAITGTNKGKGFAGNAVLVIDIFGNRLLEKDISNLYPHHDCRRLPGGEVIVVNYVPRTYDLSTQGGGTEETVWGDGYTIMDIQGNTLAAWDCFNEVNPQDDPDIMRTKGDWLHANSVNYDSQGNYYMTFNSTSELWKINPGTGEVYYRLGKQGNTEVDSQWFADGLHSPYLIAPDEVLVLDNGKSSGTSRALIYKVDAGGRKAEVNFHTSFPKEYSSQYRSNAQIIGDDLLLFGSSGAMAAVFTNFAGEVQRVISCNYAPYRAEYIAEVKY